MKTQIPVTNQKTKWIRPASRVAGSGSQFGSSASRTPIVAATVPNSSSWTIEPLRTLGHESTGRGGPAAFPTTDRRESRPHSGKEADLGLGVGIFLIAVGAIL